MKRILFFTQSASQIGGVETWLDRAHTYLSEQGFDPIVGLVRGLQYNDPSRYKDYHPDIRTTEVDGRGLNREGRVRSLVRCIRRVKPDIVIPLGIVDANEAVIRCKQRGDTVRLVAHAQGNLPPMLADLAMYRDWIDLVICPGRLTRQVLLEWAGFAPSRVLSIANGADFPTNRRVGREPGAPLRIGYIGRLSAPDKRAMDLIELHRELESRCVDYRFDIVGDGPCRSQLQSELAGFAPKVQLHGSALHAELYERFFPNLDVLVLTSSSEAFGIVLVEAMMHGVVPVTSRYDGFFAEKLVEDEINGLSFPVGDMAAAAAAVSRIADDNDLFERLSLSAAVRARDYTWGRSLGSWGRALDAVCSRPPVLGAEVPAVPTPRASGLLDRLGAPARLVDALRRMRRTVLGPAIAGGGEEWPLFNRHHSETTISSLTVSLKAMDLAHELTGSSSDQSPVSLPT